MLNRLKFEIQDFDRYLTRGTDKLCYLSDKYPGKILKISPFSKSKQIVREIRYFDFLKRRHLLPSFMPKFFGICSDNNNIGYVQEYISGDNIMSLHDIIFKNCDIDLSRLEEVILSTKEETLDKNIIILDLHSGNILVDIKNYRIWIIEGYGSSEFIPLSQYFPLFGRLKMKRQWEKFFYRYKKELSSAAKKS